ncbi:uncharacterized protein LOC6578222 [Drosophila mojavensis]|uniref:Myb-like domain-containing protein n=1 Tax=Drosophila mojavensis TaxID=7230 RepID=B4KJJ9_DROMO|nr:uncharacterized protein LOC6578222 [Drosophila mojavensis]EDW13579.2 uncharacterized protein Dmoj_GI18689 [Drosophila mojavensis]
MYVKMKAGKLKRNFWLTAEIECMLNLIKEVKISQGSSHITTTHNTFTQIASKMKRRGFPNKSPTQVRRKWFQMKSAYLCYKKGNVDRLFLIPERFRSVIAQFVENGSKLRRLPSNRPPTIERKLQPKILHPKMPVDAFIVQVKKSNSLLNVEFSRLESALFNYEQRCQSMRDYNIIKYLTS